MTRGADRSPRSRDSVISCAAGWSSSVARWAHNPEVVGSNPAPATTTKKALAARRGPSSFRALSGGPSCPGASFRRGARRPCHGGAGGPLVPQHGGTMTATQPARTAPPLRRAVRALAPGDPGQQVRPPSGRRRAGDAPCRRDPAARRRRDHLVRRLDGLRLHPCGAVRGVDARLRAEPVADPDARRVARGDLPVDLRDDRAEPAVGLPAGQGRPRVHGAGEGARREHDPDPRDPPADRRAASVAAGRGRHRHPAPGAPTA